MANGWQVPSYSMYGQTWNQQGYGMEWVFFYFLRLLFEIQLSRKKPSTSIFSSSHDFWPLLLCVFAGSLSHRAGWEGLARSPLRLQPHRVQSCPTWATTTWQGIKHSEPGVKQRGFFFFLLFIWSTALLQKGRGRIHKAFLADRCFSITGLSLQLYFTQQHSFTLNFLILYIYIYKTMLIHSCVNWKCSWPQANPKTTFSVIATHITECVNKDVWHSFNLRPVVFSSSLTHLVYWPTARNIDQGFLPLTFFFEY